MTHTCMHTIIRAHTHTHTHTRTHTQKYYQSGESAKSKIQIEWTNQHGCGGNEGNDPHKLNCNIVLQYMVQSFNEEEQEGNRVYQSVLTSD